MTTSPTRHPIVEGLHNIRDVGGYRAGDQVTKWRTLYRSDALHRLTEQGQEQFSKLGVSTIIDLRDDTERAYAPTQIRSDARIVANPIFEDVDTVLRDASLGIDEFYQGIVETSGRNLTAAIRLIAQSKNPATLVHCTAGKDRTGATIALTLTALGVDRDDVLHDYTITEQMLAGEWAERHISFMTSQNIAITPGMRRLLVQSPAEVIDEILTRITSTHGSVPDYLVAHGMPEDELGMLASHLLSSAEARSD